MGKGPARFHGKPQLVAMRGMDCIMRSIGLDYIAVAACPVRNTNSDLLKCGAI